MATCAMAKETENWVRLARLLIDVGTPCLQRLLEEEINSRRGFASFQDALKDQTIKTEIDRLHKGAKKHKGEKGQPKVLSDEQYELLTNVLQNIIGEVDITLASALLHHLCKLPDPSSGSWTEEPNEKDTSTSADIVRIRRMRNKLYGHIAHMALTDNDFDDKWVALEVVLQRLRGKRQEMQTIKSDCLQPDLEAKMRNEVMSLFKASRDDVLNLGSKMIYTLEKVPDLLTCKFSLVKDNIDCLKSMIETQQFDIEFMNTKILEVLSNMTPNTCSALVQNMDENMDKFNSMLRDTTKDIEHIKEVQAHHTKALDEIAANVTEHTKVIAKDNSDDFDELKDVLEYHAESFKILLLNETWKEITDEERDDIAYSLGGIKWNIIIDADHNSLETGLYDYITSYLKQHTDFDLVYPDTLKDVTSKAKEDISAQNKALWILANGSGEKSCPSPQITSKAKELRALRKNVSYLMNDITDAFCTCKSVLIVRMFLSAQCSDVMNNMTETMQDALSGDEATIDQNLSSFLTLIACDGIPESSYNVDFDYDNVNWQSSPNQICSLLRTASTVKDATTQFKYPGKAGPCYIGSMHLAEVKGIADLLHDSIGEVKFTGMDQHAIRAKKQEIRDLFLKGNELSFEALYIHETPPQWQVYVVRDEMKKLLSFIEEQLRKRKNFKSKLHPGYVRLTHDPSGGGSTAIKWVAYKLKTKYPCILVYKNDPQVAIFVKKIAKASMKPVLIVMDFDISEREVSALQKELDNAMVRALVVLVQQRIQQHIQPPANQHADSDPAHEDQIEKCADRSTDDRQTSHEHFNLHISSNITAEDDKVAFSDLYSEIEQENQPNKIFLYGILNFLEEYVRINKHVNDCIKQATEAEKLVLRLTCFLWTYARKSLKLRLINRLIYQQQLADNIDNSSDDSDEDTSKSKEERKEEQKKHNQAIIQKLGIANEVLVVHDNGLKPVHNCIIETLLCQLLGENKGHQLRMLINDLKLLIQNDRQKNKEDTSDLLAKILVKTKNPLIDIHFSQLIYDIEKHCTQRTVLEVLTKITEWVANISMMEAHVRALHARYLMYRVNEPELAVDTMRKALHMEHVRYPERIPGKDHILLFIFGNLLRERVKRKFYQAGRVKDAKKFLGWVTDEILLAVRSYRQSQQSSTSFYTRSGHLQLYNPRAFVGEAQAWYLLLDMNFKLICGKNIEEFCNHVKKDDLLKDGKERAMHALDNLEYLESLDKLTEQNISVLKSQAIKVKLDLLKFHFGKSHSHKEKIRHYPNNLPMDIGCLVRKTSTEHGDFVLRPWEDLKEDELRLIVDKLAERYNEKSIRSKIMVRSNYRDFLFALIYLSQPLQGRSKHMLYRLPYACEMANLWVQSEQRKNNSDQEAHFMLGVLQLVQGLDDNDKELVKKSKDNFEECKKICLENKSILAYRKRRFYIGCGEGLERVIPIEMEPSKLSFQEFEGRRLQKSSYEERVSVKPYDDIISARLHEDDIQAISGSGKRQELKFHIAISKPNLLAINVKEKHADAY